MPKGLGPEQNCYFHEIIVFLAVDRGISLQVNKLPF